MRRLLAALLCLSAAPACANGFALRRPFDDPGAGAPDRAAHRRPVMGAPEVTGVQAGGIDGRRTGAGLGAGA